jgi:16S rRNA (adenine1518-N6/adenine1519-N6)-dimethyltransferase
MQTIAQIRALLDQRGITPKHKLGQNFLHDQNQLRKLIDAANVQPGELVLEVGPGTGTLTEALLDAGAHVVACEIDPAMAAIVRERLGDRITLIEGDCLESGRRLSATVIAALGDRPFKLVANLPYQIASPLMAAMLIGHPSCTGQWMTIQKEVADRLLATPGTKAYGPLGIVVRALSHVRRIATLKPTSFWPAPKVTSAMVEILPRTADEHGIDDGRAFASFVTQLFTKRRKQLGTIFGRDRESGWWPQGVTAEIRPDALNIPQIVSLWRSTTDRHGVA